MLYPIRGALLCWTCVLCSLLTVVVTVFIVVVVAVAGNFCTQHQTRNYTDTRTPTLLTDAQPHTHTELLLPAKVFSQF